MGQSISIETWFNDFPKLPVIDVRSPVEFTRGHIPGAKNIPLLSDEERILVSKTYNQESQSAAIDIGYQLISQKLHHLVEKSEETAPMKEVIVHCWRGGMRSNAFSKLLIQNGFSKVYVLENGYKGYRNHIHTFFTQPLLLLLLGGYTGSGKTGILKCLADKGQQVIDLEHLANHRGSVFGGIGMPPQPTTEQFENDLFSAFRRLDLTKPVWIEDESITIGRVFIPAPLFARMSQQPMFFIDIPIDERLKNLINTYALLNQKELAESIMKLSKRLGLEKANLALQELKNNNYFCVASILLSYYDNYYLKSIHQKRRSKIFELKINTTDPSENATHLIHLAEKLMF